MTKSTNMLGLAARASLLPLLLAGAGCATNFEPAPLANAAPAVAEDAAMATLAGVTVTTLMPGEWPGAVDIDEELTPIKVRIQNNSAQPMAVTYNQFALRGADGHIYRALPPFAMNGAAPVAVTVRDPMPIAGPAFVYSGFEVAPFYHPLYPGLATYNGPFPVNAGYYGLYDTYFANVELPTAEMRRMALPEGVLAPGGYVEGWVYFEEVPNEADRVSFNYALRQAGAAMPMATLSIPYMVV